ncbi:restriction endonuclease [Deferribacter abyssi]|uniref:restriction endonuclease n=1 Tax=Deferribacter abyssi TaxID=213806 RepID=UPI003C27495C
MKRVVKKIEQLLSSKNYDIRISGNARFMDQKVTPDVLSVIADIIVNYVTNENREIFTRNDLMNYDYANDIITSYFNKPSVNNENAANEYDKFFSQPLKMLSYAGVLEESTNGRVNSYKILEKDILEFISYSDRNSLVFIVKYLEKVLRDSDLWIYFNNFFKRQDSENFKVLKETFSSFIIEHTPINKELEVNRIFPKILNPLSFKYRKQGAIKGYISKNIINFDDLLYNRPNWRDIKKDKYITRKEFIQKFNNSLMIGNSEARYEYEIKKAMNYVKKLEEYSEIHRFPVPSYRTIYIHHIFPKNEFPELADKVENLIALTADQHYRRAHPNGNLRYIDKSYQMICLISKLDTIEYDYLNELKNYAKESFVEVLNIGLETNYFLPTDTFEDLKHKIAKFYIENIGIR